MSKMEVHMIPPLLTVHVLFNKTPNQADGTRKNAEVHILKKKSFYDK